MNKTKTLQILNEKIDLLIIAGETTTPEYKRLCELHKSLTCSKK